MRSNLTSLDRAHFDVAVIGAGINGASSAQHLSAAGYSVLLLDKGDFGSGSSGCSTRMLHCGLRYFETPRPLLDFVLNPLKFVRALRMAKAAMETRSEIAKDSPSRVRPIKLCFPIYRDGPYKPWQLDLAFKILGAFGSKDAPLHYERFAHDRAVRLPLVNQLRDLERLHSVAVFQEYMFDWPERFCIDAALDAERMGAVVRNYTMARLEQRDDQGNWRINLSDELTDEESATLTAGVVLNMAGIWIDRVNTIDAASPRKLILGTKGAHIVVQLPQEFRDFGIATLNSIGEPHYCLPSQGGYHHIGPTETVYEGDIDNIQVDQSDVTFLIEETNVALPGLSLSDADVVYTWAGVRPLTYDPNDPKGSRSRDVHDLAKDGLPGVFAMTAGPLMSHRSAGREMTEVVRKVCSPSRCNQQPDYAPRQFPDNQNSPPLLDRYPMIKLADLAHAATQEHGINLADILFARTGVGYTCQLTDAEIERAATAVSAQLGWDDATLARQVNDVRVRIATVYRPLTAADDRPSPDFSIERSQ